MYNPTMSINKGSTEEGLRRIAGALSRSEQAKIFSLDTRLNFYEIAKRIFSLDSDLSSDQTVPPSQQVNIHRGEVEYNGRIMLVNLIEYPYAHKPNSNSLEIMYLIGKRDRVKIPRPYITKMMM